VAYCSSNRPENDAPVEIFRLPAVLKASPFVRFDD
jgi:hypothetical protein